MKILSIQKDHSASACLFYDNELIYFNKEERLSRIKNNSGLPIYCLKEIKRICDEIDVLLITGYDFHHSENLSIQSIIHKLGFKKSRKFEHVPFYKSHHLFHASKAFYSSGFDTALICVIDGKGSSYNLSTGYQANETTSIFSASYPDKFNLLYKRFFTHSKIDEFTKVIWDTSYGLHQTPIPNYVKSYTETEIRNDFDIGFMYEGTSRSIGLDDEGGKMMGLQSYGKDQPSLPLVLDDNDRFNMQIFHFDEIKRHKGFDTLKYPVLDLMDDRINFAKQVQLSFEKILVNNIEKYLEKTQHTNIVLTGGCALNVVANYKLRQHLPENISMYVEPMCGDEGNCIGAVKYFLREKYKNKDIDRFPGIYISGKRPEYDFELQSNEIQAEVSSTDVAELLYRGQIVAVFQGQAEVGPRALGNRSILFDPRIPDGKNIVNNVKQREEFRPFAATVLLDQAHEWFELDKIDESPYMMYAVQTKKDKAKFIPAVVHVDNTCRIQTVTRDQNKNFYELIKEFYKITKIPMVLNTSFNLAGDPIVETMEDAIDAMRRSSIKYLYLPDINKLITFNLLQ